MCTRQKLEYIKKETKYGINTNTGLGTYVSIFGRASEGEGNTFWQTEGTSLKDAATKMLATDAAATYFGDSLDTNQAFIEHIYENTLGKTYAEDTEGVDYWVSLLEGGATRGEVVARLVEAAQAPENAGAAQDQFNNKVAVSDYVADTIATADVADLSAFTAYIANVDDTNISVDDAKAAADSDAAAEETTSGLVTALETLDAANTAKSDFLKAQLTEYLADKDIKDAYSLTEDSTLLADEDVYDGANGAYKQDGAVDTVEEIVSKLYEDASSTLEGLSAVTVTSLSSQTATIQDAAIEAAGVTLNAAVSSAEIVAADGMTSLLSKANTKAEALTTALDAKDDADAVVTDQTTIFETLNTVSVVTAATANAVAAIGEFYVSADGSSFLQNSEDDGTADLEVATYENGAWTLTEAGTALELKEVQAYLDSLSAQTAAQKTVDNALVSLKSAVKAVYLAENDAYSVATLDANLSDEANTAGQGALTTPIKVNTDDNSVTLDFTSDVDVYATKEAKENTTSSTVQSSDAEALKDAIAAVDAYNEAVSDFTATREDKDALVAATTTVEEATAAIENATDDAEAPGLGVDLIDFAIEDFDDANEVALFVDNAGNTKTFADGFGDDGLDQIFVGSDYKFVALGEDEDLTDALGSSADLEIFYEQAGADVKLYIEEIAEAGTVNGNSNITTVVLTGTELEDITMDGGFISAGTIA